MVLGFGVSFGTVNHNLNRQATSAVNAYVAEYEHTLRRNTKNSAANLALREILEDINWRGEHLSANPQEVYDQLFCWRGEELAIVPGVRIEILDQNDDESLPSMTALRVRSISTYNDMADTAEVIVDRTSFSKYAYFTDYEGDIRFAATDVIRGPVHTNDIFRIQGGATFHGPVSSVADHYIAEGSGAPNFYGGTDFGRPSIPMPDADDLEYLKDDARAHNHIYDEEVWITFRDSAAVGVYDWEYRGLDTTYVTITHAHLDSSGAGAGVAHTHPYGGWHTHSSTRSASASIQRQSDRATNVYIGSNVWHRHFGAMLPTHTHTTQVIVPVVTASGTKQLDYETVIATEGQNNIHVKGTVNGMVTVYSGGHLWIDDDIVYADNARDGMSNDMLGLMAYKSVTVTDNAANNDGDVWIDATIASMTTELPPGADGTYAAYEKCFHVENFWTRNVNDRDQLHIYGGVVQRHRGAVGISGSTRAGFDKDYQYDTRFLKQRPPKYPVLRENLIVSWWE